MSFKRKQANKDKNHAEIELAARRAGYSVLDLSAVGKGVPDMLISDNKTTCLIEAKTDAKDAKFRLKQLKFLAEWRGYAAFVTSGEELIKLMRSPLLFCLSEKDKRNILQIVHRYEAKTIDNDPQIEVSKFEKEMEKFK